MGVCDRRAGNQRDKAGVGGAAQIELGKRIAARAGKIQFGLVTDKRRAVLHLKFQIASRAIVRVHARAHIHRKKQSEWITACCCVE